MTEPLITPNDPEERLSEALAIYEQLSGVALGPGDPRRLLLQAFVLLNAQQRAEIDRAGKTALLRYVSGEWIDDLGELVNRPRLPASAAVTTIRVVTTIPGPLVIPAGTRVELRGVTFASDTVAVVQEAETDTTVTATATETGAQTSGIGPGEATLVDAGLPWIDTVALLETSAGGADRETAEAYRARLRRAPDGFSVAGPSGAYEALARDASPAVVDVRALSRSDSGPPAPAAPLVASGHIPPGDVWVFVLAAGGLSASLAAEILAYISDETRRPLADHVEVLEPVAVEIQPDTTYYVKSTRAGEIAQIQADVAAAFADYLRWQTARIGRDIEPDQLTARLIAAGAKRAITTDLITSAPFARREMMLDELAVVPSAVEVVGGNLEATPLTELVPDPGADIPAAPGEYVLMRLTDPSEFGLARYRPSAPRILTTVPVDVQTDVFGLRIHIPAGTYQIFDHWLIRVTTGAAIAFGGFEDD